MSCSHWRGCCAWGLPCIVGSLHPAACGALYACLRLDWRCVLRVVKISIAVQKNRLLHPGSRLQRCGRHRRIQHRYSHCPRRCMLTVTRTNPTRVSTPLHGHRPWRLRNDSPTLAAACSTSDDAMGTRPASVKTLPPGRGLCRCRRDPKVRRPPPWSRRPAGRCGCDGRSRRL